MLEYRVRSVARNVKLLRDSVVDNAVMIEKSNQFFMHVIKNVFDNSDPDEKNHEDVAQEEEEREAEEKSSSQQEPDDCDSSDSSNPPDEDRHQPSGDRTQLNKPYKSLFREIMKRVHPDRYEILEITSDEETQRLQKIYGAAKKAAQESNEPIIIEICAQLEIDLSKLDQEYVKDCLESSQASLRDKISSQQGSLGWVWQMSDLDMEGKIKLVRAFIASTQYRDRSVSDTLIKDVIQSYNKDGSRKKR